MNGRVLRFPPRGPTQRCFLCGAERTHARFVLQIVTTLDRCHDAEELYASEARLCAACVSKTEAGPLVLFEAAHELAITFAAESVAAFDGDEEDGEPH